MSFFSRKMKPKRSTIAVKSRVPKRKRMEEISSDSDIGTDASDDLLSDEETAAEKKLRLTKEILAEMHAEEAENEEDEEARKEVIKHRLHETAMEQAGRLQKEVASLLCPVTSEDICFLRGHQRPVTAVVVSFDAKFVFSASKDCSIIKWCVSSKKKLKVVPRAIKKKIKQDLKDTLTIGHSTTVLCLALTSDSQYLAAGDMSNEIRIYDGDLLNQVHVFLGHRAPVSGLAFRLSTHQLFSCSFDKTVKIWSVDDRAFVETLFGSEDHVQGIDSGIRERAITCGGCDGAVRVWKVVEESQLVFHGHKGSIDCVALVNEESFVTGADDNSLSLWNVRRKNPVYSLKKAHGDRNPSSWASSSNWISAVAALRNADIIASGSRDSGVKLWRIANNSTKLEFLSNIPVHGTVNSLSFDSAGSVLCAALGTEHRLGRWWRDKENSQNAVAIVHLKYDDNSVKGRH